MKLENVIYILRLILCTPEMQKFLREAALKTDTPIDNHMLDVVYSLLCEKTP